MQPREWFTVEQACEYLSISRTTLYKLCNEGKLPYYEIDGVEGRRFKREDLDALLQPAQPEEEQEAPE